jgi:PhoH-like ATPase
VQKNYILDTNVLIHDPQSIFKFEDNNLYIPIYVLEELDKLKSEITLRGRNSREACRILDELRCQGSLIEGVAVGADGKLRIYVPKERKVIKVALDHNSMDNAILQCSIEIKESADIPAILVTMDVNLRIRAECIGLQTASYESQSVDVSTLDNEVKEIIITKEELDLFYSAGFLTTPEDLFINASVLLKDEISGATALGRVKFDGASKVVKKLNIPNNILGLKPRNIEQKFAIDLLLDDSIKFVTLMGTAGSGKSILSVAVALYKIFEDHIYEKLLVSRPVMPLGKDIGYLPGSTEEKLRPFMQPIYDNIDYILMSSGSRKKYKIESCQKLFDDNIIEIEPLVYIRGRSIINQIMILDEAQSLSNHEIKTIISRCGENTKLILTGDVDQIDNPYVTKESNGLTSAVKNIKNNPIVGHIFLSKGERSELANLAVENL